MVRNDRSDMPPPLVINIRIEHTGSAKVKSARTSSLSVLTLSPNAVFGGAIEELYA